MSEQTIPMHCTRWLTVYQCECEVEKIGENVLHLWEPLHTSGIPKDARPYCYGLGEIDFYDPSGNTCIAKSVKHHDLGHGNIIVLLADGRFAEVASGRVLWREGVGPYGMGSWWMCWLAYTNGRKVRMLTAGKSELDK